MSKHVPIWRAEILQGRLSLADSNGFHEYCRTLSGTLEVIVRKESLTQNRSSKQNRYYWGVEVTILSEFFGYETDETHEALLAEYSRVHSAERRPGDPPMKIVRSSKMTTSEFLDYTTWVRRWAAMEYAIMLPEPNEVMI